MNVVRSVNSSVGGKCLMCTQPTFVRCRPPHQLSKQQPAPPPPLPPPCYGGSSGEGRVNHHLRRLATSAAVWEPAYCHPSPSRQREGKGWRANTRAPRCSTPHPPNEGWQGWQVWFDRPAATAAAAADTGISPPHCFPASSPCLQSIL